MGQSLFSKAAVLFIHKKVGSAFIVGPVALPSHAAAGLDSCWDLGRFAQHLQYKKKKNPKSTHNKE
jgi:hypothetical protein